MLPVEFHGVLPHGTTEPAAAHARLREAALDLPPRLRLGDPRLQPAGVVPEAVLPVPAPGHGAARAPVGDHEREHGEREHGDDEQEHEGHVHPEERRGGVAAPAGAGEADEREQQQCAAERDDGDLQGALALRGGAREEVDARAQHRQGQEERHQVQGAQEAVAQPRH